MKKKFLLLPMLLPLFCVSQDLLMEQANRFRLFRNQNIDIDLKFIDPDKGSFGIDYKLHLSRAFRTYADSLAYLPPNVHFNYIGTGFLTVKGDANQLNSITNELNFELSPITRQKKITRTESILDFLNMDSTARDDKTREEASKVSSPFWLMFNLHAAHEATQNFANHDYAIGIDLAFTTSYLSAILDFPFGLLRAKPNNNPRQLDVALRYDLVTDLDNTASKELRNKYSANRLSLHAEWETGIFMNERISFAYHNFFELNAPQAIRNAGLDKNYFYQVKVSHRLSGKNDRTSKTIAIKYSQGSLPPDFTKGYILGGGFSIDF